MLGHQAIGVTDPVEPFHRLRQRAQKQRAVGIKVTEKDRAPFVAACGHMVQGAGKCQSKGTGHIAFA